MLTVLEGIYSFISNIGAWFIFAIISVINLLIVALAALAQALLDGISVGMPAAPTLPTQFTAVEAWVAWFIPVGTIADIAVFYATAWLMWFIVSIGLRWVRAES